MQDNESFWTKFKTPLGLIVGMGTNTKLQSLKFAKNTIFEKTNLFKTAIICLDKEKEKEKEKKEYKRQKSLDSKK